MAEYNYQGYPEAPENDSDLTELAHDITEYEMRAERLRQAASHIADYSRRFEELNMRREKTRAILNEMEIGVRELQSIKAPHHIIESIYGISDEEEGYSDGYKSNPQARPYSQTLKPFDL